MAPSLADFPTPPLREDLRLHPASPGADGEPAWTIQDRVLNRFYRIGWLEFECLLHGEQTPRQISEAVAAQTPLQPDVDQVLDFYRFLRQHALLRLSPGPEAAAQAASEPAGLSTWKWWLHHYLFFRIPLLHPQHRLQALVKKLGWLFNRYVALAVVLLSLVGIVLVLHQWDTFTHAVVESFSSEGLLSFAVALALAKTLHELAHALVATRLGVKVAHMGIAFVVMWPMLYTDTGESWKLRSARQRLAVASAGILAELALAGLATLGWALSEPGPARNAMLYLATTSWLLSLALNASPFMRFDGYFILSDLLDFPNLHERSQRLARTALRRGLLGLDEPWPEAFPKARRRALVAFAVCTWVYRLVLFLGIAVAVYLFFFKALGLVLFAVEILYFILQPVARELRHWWAWRSAVPTRHRLVWAAVLLGGLVLLAVPWRTQVHAVGMARAAEQVQVYAPYPALLLGIREPGPVHKGDSLAVLEAPDIAAGIRANQASIRGYQGRLAGLLADPDGLAQAAVTRQQLTVEYRQLSAARNEIGRLQLLAPFEGQWLDTDPDWHSGQWVNGLEPMGILVANGPWWVDAYVKQDQVRFLAEGGAARFYPEGQFAPLKGKVLSIGTTRISQLEQPSLASRHGGPLNVVANAEGLVPNPPLFRVVVALDAPPGEQREMRGQLQLEGARRSWLGEAFTGLLSVALRESGF